MHRRRFVFTISAGEAAEFTAHRARQRRRSSANSTCHDHKKRHGAGRAGGTPVQMWILQPPGFNPKKKWPLVFLVHGGPQGAWEDSWSNRWNPEVWAAQGYVVALPNPRGSTGFGQQFTDEISGDWGGRCFEDLMACLAYLEKQPYIDKSRMAAAGASFGGYMMNWFQGHTDQFKTLITHCGVYNFDSMYATTDEIWFDEWEHGGPPWANRESYEKFSPHLYAKNFKTSPMLKIHPQRSRFSRSLERGLSALLDSATARCALALVELPGRRPLGAQAREQQVLAPGSIRLAQGIRAAGGQVTRCFARSRSQTQSLGTRSG